MTSSSSSSSEPITPHQESSHSFRFSSPNTASTGLALALSKDSQQSENLTYITQITSSLELIDMPNTLPTTTTTNGCLTPVTPDDREPINSSSNKKRSASFSCLKSGHRHRTSLASNTLYPSTSTTTCATSITSAATSTADQSISRYLPQNQAVITTQDNWRISLANHIATMILSGSKRNNTQDFIGKHILDFIDVSHRPLLLEKIVERRDDYQHVNINGSVLICGDVVCSNICYLFFSFFFSSNTLQIPIIKQDGTKSSASLWLKEKKGDNGSSIFIWILEEVFQSTIKIQLSDCNKVESIDNEDANELLGYSSTELSQKPIQQLVPQYNAIDKFFGCRTKLNAYFPVMIGHTDQHTIRITSMPALAGLVTVNRKSGLIQSCDTAFSKYLFGYRDLSNVSLSKLIPQYTTLISCLERDELLLDGYILNNSVCCDILGANIPQQQQKTQLPVIISAVHRDGTCFDIDLQIKLLDGQNAYALWITFDRETVFQRRGHKTSIHKLQQQQFEKETTNLAVTTSNSGFIRSKSVNLPTKPQKTLLDSPTTATNTKNVMGENASQERPSLSKITSFSRPAFTSVLSKNATTGSAGSNPPTAAISKSIWPRVGEYSAQTLKTSIRDYEIVDELGQGAYGLVKLAYLKSDPEKVKTLWHLI